MKRISFKKILPGIVSIAIIAGMAIQSFATNVDMAAFVNKDKYMTKYYELDYRIDEIEKVLERTYKFTCTNVRTWVGATTSTNTVYNFWGNNQTTRSYHWQTNPLADLSEEGYLRVNAPDMINNFLGHGKTDKWVTEIPASRMILREGIEAYPETKMTIETTRVWPNTTSINQNPTYTTVMTIGPFKKFPYITTTNWQTSSLFLVKEKMPVFYGENNKFQYQYGTRTQPTSWRGTSTGYLSFSTANTPGNSFTQGFPNLNLYPTVEEFTNNIYSLGSRSGINTAFIYAPAAIPVDLSSRTDIWLRQSYSGTIDTSADAYVATITTWNTNK